MKNPLIESIKRQRESQKNLQRYSQSSLATNDVGRANPSLHSLLSNQASILAMKNSQNGPKISVAKQKRNSGYAITAETGIHTIDAMQLPLYNTQPMSLKNSNYQFVAKAKQLYQLNAGNQSSLNLKQLTVTKPINKTIQIKDTQAFNEQLGQQQYSQQQLERKTYLFAENKRKFSKVNVDESRRISQNCCSSKHTSRFNQSRCSSTSNVSRKKTANQKKVRQQNPNMTVSSSKGSLQKATTHKRRQSLRTNSIRHQQSLLTRYQLNKNISHQQQDHVIHASRSSPFFYSNEHQYRNSSMHSNIETGNARNHHRIPSQFLSSNNMPALKQADLNKQQDNLSAAQYIQKLESCNALQQIEIQQLRRKIKQKDSLLDDCEKQVYHLKEMMNMLPDSVKQNENDDKSSKENNIVKSSENESGVGGQKISKDDNKKSQHEQIQIIHKSKQENKKPTKKRKSFNDAQQLKVLTKKKQKQVFPQVKPKIIKNSAKKQPISIHKQRQTQPHKIQYEQQDADFLKNILQQQISQQAQEKPPERYSNHGSHKKEYLSEIQSLSSCSSSERRGQYRNQRQSNQNNRNSQNQNMTQSQSRESSSMIMIRIQESQQESQQVFQSMDGSSEARMLKVAKDEIYQTRADIGRLRQRINNNVADMRAKHTKGNCENILRPDSGPSINKDVLPNQTISALTGPVKGKQNVLSKRSKSFQSIISPVHHLMMAGPHADTFKQNSRNRII